MATKAICVLLLSFSFFLLEASGAYAQSSHMVNLVARSLRNKPGKELELKPDEGKNSQVSLNGLEDSDYKKVGLRIYLEKDKSVDSLPGLTEERIRTKCELRIRQAGLEPVLEKFNYLAVLISTNSAGAFAIQLRFERWAVFGAKGTTYGVFAPTWISAGFGNHLGQGEVIINSLDGHLDKFLNEYLKANASQNK